MSTYVTSSHASLRSQPLARPFRQPEACSCSTSVRTTRRLTPQSPFLNLWSAHSTGRRQTVIVARSLNLQCSLKPAKDSPVSRPSLARRAAEVPAKVSKLVEQKFEDETLSMITLLAGIFAWAILADNASAQELVQTHDGSQELWSVAEGESFWSNMGRYAKYFVTLVAGTGYVIVKPLFQFLKKPQTAIPLIIVVYGLVVGLKLALATMLGLNDPDTLGPMAVTEAPESIAMP